MSIAVFEKLQAISKMANLFAKWVVFYLLFSLVLLRGLPNQRHHMERRKAGQKGTIFFSLKKQVYKNQ